MNTHDNDRPSRTSEELDRELEALLAEAEETVGRLRREMKLRRENAAQHAEIDHLVDHMADAQVRWSEVRAFFNDVLHQLVSRNHGAEGEHKAGDHA
ncbi:hypothetical protein IEU95_13190 [Hoyosella rhizosphaerae]|uniref:Uncharacterized protein n=1 Tax=Hoyosella rhizosphaerae TaxID=1755582 RepID=A0A916U6C1_9ACTN|nr:hypothetical protein [Hoyosella rhizosphaerae]MBN4927793.1 hypothetical protein [Hoyosella rhizosphaerae]GGC61482.1 hypothetical protein GCM10011410_12450 [Hoyosella rhizosphaerae]